MAIDFERVRHDANQRREPNVPRDYNATREQAAANLDALIDKYLAPTDYEDIAIIMAGVQALDPHFYDDE